VDDGVGRPHGGSHDRLVAHVALDEVEIRVGAEVEDALLPGAEREVVEGRHAMPRREELFAEDAADVTEAAGDEDTLGHDGSSVSVRGRRSGAGRSGCIGKIA